MARGDDVAGVRKTAGKEASGRQTRTECGQASIHQRSHPLAFSALLNVV
jgi:hypothetical protein